jgi:predicted nucleotidyltransferase
VNPFRINRYHRDHHRWGVHDERKRKLYKENTMKIEKIKERILPILKKYNVKRAGMFGSVARAEARRDSDIDILVELPDDATLFDLVGLKIELEERLKRKVDVLTYNSIYHLLKERILSEEIGIL